MAYKRKRSVSRSGRRKRTKLASRYTKRMKGLRNSRNRNNVHHYKRWGESDTFEFEGDGAATYYAPPTGEVFTLADIQGHSELTALYDQYKISCVIFKFQMLNIPVHTYPGVSTAADSTYGTAATGNQTAMYPKLWYYRDYDDSVAITDLDAFKEIGKAKCLVLEPNKVYTFKIRPAIQRGLTTGYYEPAWPKMINCGGDTIAHFGFKWMLDCNGMTTPADQYWKIRVDRLFYVKMFNSR